MTQHETPERGALLGRASGADGSGTAVGGAVILLPGRPGMPLLSPGPVRALVRELARAGGPDGLAAHVVRGGADDSPERAVDEVVRRYGDVPVCLAGYGTGGLAALRGGGHPAVNSVLALAPWVPDEPASVPPEPVKHLAGRQVLIVHGTNDGRADPELSFRLAARAKKANRSTCRFEVHSDGHRLREHRAEVVALAVDFVLGAVMGGRWSRPVTDALAAPPPLGLRMPLASGFGRSLRG